MRAIKRQKKTKIKINIDCEVLPDMCLRNNIRFFAPFLDPKALSPFSRKTLAKFIKEWNQELKRRGKKEEKV